MADGVYRFQNGTSSPFYPRSNPHAASRPPGRRQVSPIRSSRFDLSNDLPSPSRSPGRHSPPGQSFVMYNQSHQQGHNVFMNGGHPHSRYGMQQMGSNKPFSNSNQHQNHGHRGQQDHVGQSHSNFSSHQHNNSTPGIGSATPHFTSNQMRNGTPGHAANGSSKPPNEHWAQQLTLAQQAREAIGTHFHARNSNLNKVPASSSESARKETEREERNRAVTESNQQQWNELDMGGQGLRSLAAPLFGYPFLTSLYLNNNRIAYLPPEIGRLRKLTHLDVSNNLLRELPAEIGMLTDLKSLWLFDNDLETLPYEVGYLHHLDMLGIEGNPLDEGYKSLMVDQGTKALVTALRDHMQVPEVNDRPLITISEVKAKGPSSNTDSFSIMTYNTLCDRAATTSLYGYTPEGALSWEHRRGIILQELQARNADILCLQEVDTENFHEFFRPELAHKDYKGVFWPKTRARTMAEKEAKIVDGCATFFNNSKYVLLDKQCIELSGLAIKRPDMRTEHDLFNRVMPKDNIAIITFLEDRQSGTRLIVVNAHIHWDPLFADVKVVQTAILMEEVTRLAETFAQHPPCKDKMLYRFSDGDDGDSPKPELPEPAPSVKYSSGTEIPMIVCGDFNSLPDSGVYELLATGQLRPDHKDLGDFKYGNLTRNGMSHPFGLKSAYGSIGELKFTNYTPGFVGVVDYIWYSTSSLQVLELLGDIDPEYLKRVPGFPNVHFPSDHVALQGKFSFKQRKERPRGQQDGDSSAQQ